MRQLEKDHTHEDLILPEVAPVFDTHSALNGLAKALHLLRLPAEQVHVSSDSEAFIDHSHPANQQ